MNRVCAWLLLFTLVSTSIEAQSLVDDIVNSDIDSLKSKQALLKPSFKEMPYLAIYLSKTEDYQESFLQYLIDQGANPNQIDDSGVSALYYALSQSNESAVSILLKAKADPNASWTMKSVPGEATLRSRLDGHEEWEVAWTIRPLFISLFSSNPQCSEDLLAYGADPLATLGKAKDTKKSTSSSIVYITNSTIDYIIGTYSTAVSDYGQRISAAFFSSSVKMLQAANKNQKTKMPVWDKSLTQNIYYYFSMGMLDDFKRELLKTYKDTITFIPYAVLAGNWEIVDLIYKYNQLDVNDKCEQFRIGSEQGSSIIEWALRWLHPQAVKLLIDHGAKIPDVLRIEYKEGNTSYGGKEWNPIAWAVRGNAYDVVKVLLDNGVSANDEKSMALAIDKTRIRSLLIDSGARLDTIISYSRDYSSTDRVSPSFGSLLFCAAIAGSSEAVEYFLKAGLNAKGDPNTIPPLFGAIIAAKPDIVQSLLDHGADSTATLVGSRSILWSGGEYEGITPLQLTLALAKKEQSGLVKARFMRIARLLGQ
jgi:ankyrin repeat protein